MEARTFTHVLTVQLSRIHLVAQFITARMEVLLATQANVLLTLQATLVQMDRRSAILLIALVTHALTVQ